jgi:hypothetical protein
MSGAMCRKWNAGYVLIGKDPCCNLWLDHREVSNWHAYLQVIGGRVFCVDLWSETGTHWENGSDGSGWLDADRTVRIGPFRIRLAGSNPFPSDDPLFQQIPSPLQVWPKGRNSIPRLFLEVKRGDHEPVPWHMKSIVVLLGSSPRCKICLKGPDIQPFHGSLVRTPSGTWFVNFGGVTRLNGVAIGCARVEEGDVLQIGRFRLHASYDPVRSPDTPNRLVQPAPGAPALAPNEEAANEPLAKSARRHLTAPAKSPGLLGSTAQGDKAPGTQVAREAPEPQASSAAWQLLDINEPDSPAAAWLKSVRESQVVEQRGDANLNGSPQSILLQLLSQHCLMQQQMTQHQESMSILCNIVSELLKDQRGAIREDIAQLQQTTQNLNSIHLQLANKTPIKIGAPVVESPKASVERPFPSGQSVNRILKTPEGPSSKRPNSAPLASEKAEADHSLLIERMAALQDEQRSHLHRLLKFLHSKLPGGAS